MLRITILCLLFIASSLIGVQAARQNNTIEIEELGDCGEGVSCIRVTGHSSGNHALDCTVIQPWNVDEDPGEHARYPTIAWANGWEQGNVLGQCVTSGYLPGLKQWADQGKFIVAAANQWSAQESDVLACLDWVLNSGHYKDLADANRTGLAGHSQGGGAVIKAGAGSSIPITATIAMNPYGPSWVNTGEREDSLLLLGGSDDTTTPESSYLTVWEAIQVNGVGGILAELEGGSHNSEAWGTGENGETLTCENAAQKNFGKYQQVSQHWWDYYLNAQDSNHDLGCILTNAGPAGSGTWDTHFTDPGNWSCP